MDWHIELISQKLIMHNKPRLSAVDWNGITSDELCIVDTKQVPWTQTIYTTPTNPWQIAYCQKVVYKSLVATTIVGVGLFILDSGGHISLLINFTQAASTFGASRRIDIIKNCRKVKIA